MNATTLPSAVPTESEVNIARVVDALRFVAQEARVVAKRYESFGESEMTRRLRQALYMLAQAEARRDGLPMPARPVDL